jgi:hydrogenase maturation protease
MPEDLLDVGGPVIVVDAVHGLEPGTIVDLPLTELPELFASGVSPGSSHALPLPMILGIVERLAGGLPEGRFIGVAGADFALGAGLSAQVLDAIEPCAARLNHWVRALAHERRAPQCA